MFENTYIKDTLSQLSVQLLLDRKNLGSGILYRLTGHNKSVCLITAKHCVLDDEKKLYHVQDLSILYRGESYLLTTDERILLHGSQDLAVILFNAAELQDVFNDLPGIKLVNDAGGETSALFYGYPVAEKYPFPTRVDTHVLPGASAPLIFLETALTSENNVTAVTLAGFSGSGLILKSGGNIYLHGIIIQITQWDRFKALHIGLLNEILNKDGIDPEPFLTFEADPELIRSYGLLNKNSQSLLTGINESIAGHHIDRKQLFKEAAEKLRSNNALLVSGIAGIGKSTFSKELINYLEDQENAKVLSFFGAQICKVNTIELLAQLQISNSIEEILKSKDLAGFQVIYIDSAEKTFESNQLNALKEILQLTKTYPQLKIILSIRSYALTLTTFSLFSALNIKNDRLEIQLLNDEELIPLITAFPQLNNLLANAKIATFLRTPFYLNLIVGMLDEFKDADINEQILKARLWDHVIKKDNIRREKLFELIAIERTVALVPYISMPDHADSSELSGLLSDHVLNERKDNFGTSSFAPAHDIFEDWALVRYTNALFQKSTDLQAFFVAIGTAYAKRRGFRFWLQELYRVDEHKAQTITTEVLSNTQIESFWKDEVIIAMLKADNCLNFLKAIKATLLKDDSLLLIKSMHLLQTAGKEAIKIPFTPQFLDENDHLTSELMTPVGPGWNALVIFLSSLPPLDEHFHPVLISFLLDWGKFDESKLAPAAKAGSKIVKDLLNLYGSDYERDAKRIGHKYVGNLIELLFKLTGENLIDVEAFVRSAIDALHKKPGKTIAPGKKTHRFQEKVLSMCIDHKSSEFLCKYLPDLVWEIALNHWVEPDKPPVAAKKESNDRLPISRMLNYSRRPEKEELCGLKNESRRGFYPESSLQTPLPHLLKYHQAKALGFLTHLLNKAISKYCASGYGDCISVTLVISTDKTIIQYGSEGLWRLYRDSNDLPDLLASLLMALENHLLSLAGGNTAEKKAALFEAIDFLYAESNSVATTAVIASVAQAYSTVIGEKAIPLFSFKEAFKWDWDRSYKERHVFTPPDTSGKNPGVQQERVESKRLPHRSAYLESLLLKMSIYTRFSGEISQLVNGYQDELKKVKNFPNYPHWPFVLNRLDKRNLKIVSQTADTWTLQSIMPKKLRRKAAILDSKLQMPKGIEIWNWCHEILDKGLQDKNQLKVWRDLKKSSIRILTDTGENSNIYNPPAGLAEIGLTYHYAELSSSERKWCIDILIDISSHFVNNPRDFYNTSVGKYSDYNKDIAYSYLPQLLKFSDNKRKSGTIRELVQAILHTAEVDNGNNKPHFEKMAKNCWDADAVFAEECFWELLYNASQLDWKFGQRPAVEIKAMPTLTSSTSADVLFNLDKAFLFLTEAPSINSDGLKFLLAYQDIILNDGRSRRNRTRVGSEDYYHGKLNFQFKYGQLMLAHDSETSVPLFSKLVDFLTVFTPEELENFTITDEHVELVRQCMMAIIYYEDQHHQTKRFQTLWLIMAYKTAESKRMYFVRFLLLEWYWRDSIDTWPVLQQYREFYIKVLNQFGAVDILKTLRFIAGVGFKDMFPESLEIFSLLARHVAPTDWAMDYNAEKYIQRAYYLHGSEIKADQQMKANFFVILDRMLGAGSSVAYLIKEAMISL